MIRLKKEKPKNGKLIQVLPSGNHTTLVDNKPFAALQEAKKRYIQRGYSANTLRITYLNKDRKKPATPQMGDLFKQS